MKRVWHRTPRTFVVWQCGSVAEELALETIAGLGASPMSGLRQVTLSYPGGGRCLAEIIVEVDDDLSRVKDALLPAGLTVARSAKKAQRVFEQAADQNIQAFVRHSLAAGRVVDLLACDPSSLTRSAATPVLVEVADALNQAHAAIVSLTGSTASGLIKAHLAQALERTTQARALLSPDSTHPLENALRPAVAMWSGILTKAAAMLEPLEHPDLPGAWRERLSRFLWNELGKQFPPPIEEKGA